MGPDQEELAQLQEDWMCAVQERDMERLEEIVADGFRFTAIHLAPEPMSREQWIAAAQSGYNITSFAYLNMDIDVFGDAAVVHSRYSQVANLGHHDLSNTFRLTDVWSRINGRWRVVARHSSILG
jgi:ketosteroid isomerase-like protein